MQDQPNFDNVGATPTDAAQWRGNRSAAGVPVTVPSGNVALCRRPGIDVFMSLGLVPNSLMGIIQKQISKAQKGATVSDDAIQKELEKLAGDPSKLAEILQFADNVTCFICIQPKVEPVPVQREGEPVFVRDPDALYVDEVLMEDKMFLFQWAVGGTESLETFREQLSAGVGTSPGGENMVN